MTAHPHQRTTVAPGGVRRRFHITVAAIGVFLLPAGLLITSPADAVTPTPSPTATPAASAAAATRAATPSPTSSSGASPSATPVHRTTVAAGPQPRRHPVTPRAGDRTAAPAHRPLPRRRPAVLPGRITPGSVADTPVVRATVQAQAQAGGTPVEDLSQRTDTTATFANPDGSWTTQESAVPTQYEDPTGTWHPIDTTLTVATAPGAPAGSLSPTAAPVQVLFSGPEPAAPAHPRVLASLSLNGTAISPITPTGPAGSGTPPLLTAAQQAAENGSAAAPTTISLVWPGAIPAPTVAGDTATYPNILPGITLRLRAARTGFEDSWILTSPVAAVSLPLLTLSLQLSGLTSATDSTGLSTLTTAAGTAVAQVSAPVMFDATRDASGNPTAYLPVATAAVATAAGVNLNLTLDEAYLANPTTRYPVTIDPTTTTIGPSFDTYVQSNSSTDLSATGSLHLGEFSTYQSRSYLSWDTSAFKNATIQAATLSLWNAGAPSCATTLPWQLYSSAAATTATRWGTQPAVGGSALSTSSQVKGATGCAAGYITINAQKWLSDAAAAASGTTTLMLRAGNETDTAQQKVFASSQNSNPPQLNVTYDRAPATPTAPAPSPAGTYNSVRYTSTTKPTFTTTATDPDGDPLTTTVSVYPNSAGTGSPTATCTTPSTTSGTAATCTVTTALTDNTTYWAQAQAKDGSGLTGPASTLTSDTFKVAAATPPVPTISCAGYANGSDGSNLPANPVSCTITATGTSYGAPTQITTTVDGTTKTTAVTQGSSSTVTVTVANTKGPHTVQATSTSPSGLVSTAAAYSFSYGAWVVALTGDQPTFTAGSAVTLTATVNYNLSASGDGVGIYDQTTGTLLNYCTGNITTCYASASFSSGGLHTYIAYVTTSQQTSIQNANFSAVGTSSAVTASRAPWTITLTEDKSVFGAGGYVTLTAQTNQYFSLTGGTYGISIFDQTTGALLNYCDGSNGTSSAAARPLHRS